MNQRTLLITGASGHLGRLALSHVLSLGLGDRIVAGSRNTETLAEYASKGVELRSVDFDWDEKRLAEAFKGVDRLLLVSTDALDRPGRRLEQHIRAIAAARIANVKHILYTSMVRPDSANSALLAHDHRGTEEAIRVSGIAYTILRNNWYIENLLPGLPYAVSSGGLSDATGNSRVAYVSREDCARAAACALASQETQSSVREISGPELLSLSDLAKILSVKSGKPVQALPVDGTTRRAQLQAAGLPEVFADVIANAEEAMAQGWFAVLSDDVRHLTGTPPRSFGDLALS